MPEDIKNTGPLGEKAPLHWLAVGYVSPSARKTLIELGGRIDEISHDPPFLAVALPDNPEGYWSWSHGQQQHRAGIEFWNTGELQMERMTLLWGPRSPECYSIETTYLIQPWEEFDGATRQVKEEQTAPVAVVASTASDPFLDSDDGLP